MEAQRGYATCLRSHSSYVEERETGNLTKITKLRSGSKERSDNMPKITQLLSGSTERLGNLLMITQLISGRKRS